MKPTRGSEFGSSFSRSIPTSSSGGSSAGAGMGRHGVSSSVQGYNLNPGARSAAPPQRLSPNGASLGEQRGKIGESSENTSLERDLAPFHTSKALFDDPAERKGVFRDAMGMYTKSAPGYQDLGITLKILGIVFVALILAAATYRCERNAQMDEDAASRPVRHRKGIPAKPQKITPRRELGLKR